MTAAAAPRFRDDINGLRAIAVLGVVAYHFGLAGVRGGFTGVDVFFVISGFLMTQIIVGRLDTGRFALLDFYGARVRRIVPALVAMVACVTLAGYLLLDPLKLDVLARDAATSLGFVSNILYLGQGGYFAAAADQNWLLHTWSLSVEWQFYILYPILLVLLYRAKDRAGARTRTILAVLAALAVLSFAKTVASAQSGGGSLSAAFYMIHARAWEFIAGAFCTYAVPRLARGLSAQGPSAKGHSIWGRALRVAAHAAGLALILAGMVLLQSRTAVWPSALTTIPVLGAALVLAADLRHPGWARFAPVQALGRWSYSIYLWHWPLAAMGSYFGLSSPGARVAGALLSILLGALSYAWIERRATDALWGAPRRPWRLGLPAFGAALALALVAIATNGLESVRFALRPDVLAALRDYRAAEADWMWPQRDCSAFERVSSTFEECRFGRATARDTLVIGDSFVQQLVPRYAHALDGSAIGLTFVMRGGCIPMPGVERLPFGSNCAKWADDAYRYARAEPFKRVVFVAFWYSYDRAKVCLLAARDCGASLDDKAFGAALDAGYARMAAEWRALAAQGKEVVVVAEPPFGEGDPADLYQQALGAKPVETLSMSLAEFEAGKAEANARLAAAARAAGATLVDPAAALCPNGTCPFVEHGRTLYKDAFHLRASRMKDARFAVYDRYILPGLVTRASIN